MLNILILHIDSPNYCLCLQLYNFAFYSFVEKKMNACKCDAI